MGATNSHVHEHLKLTSDQQILVKEVWIGIENNPQFHGSIFFMGFCEIYPRYIKYFTTEPRLPLTFDARTNAKFTVIMETMGYLLLDFHKKPKQLDQIISYIAMIHKDMSLERSDMFNFGVSLLEYLTITFPMAMTPDCYEVMSKCMNNLLEQLSQKIEDFKQDEILGQYEISAKTKASCGQWLLCRERLVYGQTLQYWKDRKNKWDERLNDWKVKDSTIVDPVKTSTTEDEETSNIKSKTEDETSEFAESTAWLPKFHGITQNTEIVKRSHTALSCIDAPKAVTSDQKLTANFGSERPEYPANRNDNVFLNKILIPEITDPEVSRFKTPREKRRNILTRGSKTGVEETVRTSSVPNYEIKSNAVGSAMTNERHELRNSQAQHVEHKEINSLARQRRRQSQVAQVISPVSTSDRSIQRSPQ